jgi:hypothetical protein
MAWHAAHVRVKINAYRILDIKREGKAPSGRLKHMWESNIKMSMTIQDERMHSRFI